MSLLLCISPSTDLDVNLPSLEARATFVLTENFIAIDFFTMTGGIWDLVFEALTDSGDFSVFEDGVAIELLVVFVDIWF